MNFTSLPSPYFDILLIGFGLIIGSFLNVCIFRMPLDQSVITPSSHCPSCKSNIPWRYKIPILSFLYLKGHCFYCKIKIPWQYPFIEFLTAAILFLHGQIFFSFPEFLGYSFFILSLLVASVIDIHHRIIPDEISLGGLGIGFFLNSWILDLGWKDSLFGLLLGGSIFFILAYLYEKKTGVEGLGGGDVKLIAMIGAWLGVEKVLLVIFISSALGSIFGIALIWLKKTGMKTSLPFGPFLALAAILCFYFGGTITQLFFP